MAKRDDVLRILTDPVAGKDGFEIEPAVAEKGMARYEEFHGESINDDKYDADTIAINIYDLWIDEADLNG